MSIKLLTIMLVAVFVFVIGYGAFLLYVSWPVQFGNIDKAGMFGDSFGILTSLFSGIAIVLIFMTMLLQKKELASVKEQFDVQNTTLKKQNFENTFFQLLRLRNETASALEIKQGSATIKGKDCFRFMFEKFAHTYGGFDRHGLDERIKINEAYNNFYRRFKHEVSHYFRTIHAVVKFIESSEDKNENVKFYVNLIRVQLSERELLMIFYHSLDDNRDGLKPLVEKYALFESLPIANLLLPEEHKSLYNDSAYNYCL